MDAYGTTGELKKKAFKAVKRMQNNQLVYKWPLFWKLSFKSTFLAIHDHFTDGNASFLNPALRWECAHVCLNLKTEKGGFYGKQWKYKTSSLHTSHLHLRK